MEKGEGYKAKPWFLPALLVDTQTPQAIGLQALLKADEAEDVIRDTLLLLLHAYVVVGYAVGTAASQDRCSGASAARGHWRLWFRFGLPGQYRLGGTVADDEAGSEFSWSFNAATAENLFGPY